MTYVVAAMVVVTLFEGWCLWRVLDRLSVVGRIEERLLTLANTVRLLTDTTETCFQVVAGQLELEQSQRTISSGGRVERQRRVIGAAQRGRSASQIAADEEIAESEVCLRLHLAEQDESSRRERHGKMRA